MTPPTISTQARQDCFALANSVLLLYLQAVELRRLNVAEHLLEALEELAECEPCCKSILDQAYVRIANLERLNS